jgi:hypothetical protein
MANAVTVQESKFFRAPAREILEFKEEDFDSLQEFKDAIADQVHTLAAQHAELRFQHKGFLRGNTWSMDINKLTAYCDSMGCKLVQYGTKDNNYQWRIVPRMKLVDSASVF